MSREFGNYIYTDMIYAKSKKKNDAKPDQMKTT